MEGFEVDPKGFGKKATSDTCVGMGEIEREREGGRRVKVRLATKRR